jgi:hypothetical protein
MRTDALSYLSEELDGTIYFRDERATQYPDDSRNKAAADLMRRLQRGIEGLYGSRTEERIDAALKTIQVREFNQDHSEAESAFWRSIGFGYFPESADELANDVAALFEAFAAPDEEEAA